MFRLRLIILTASMLASLQLFAPDIAAQQENRSTPTGVALEVTYFKGKPPTYQTVPGIDSKANGSWYALFRRVPSWQLPAGELPVQAVNVTSRLETAGIRVYVSLFRGTRFHEKEEQVASFLIREDEKISVRELGQFGLEPFEIKAFRVTPTLADPPTARSNAESIAVIGIEPVRSTLPTYKIKLQNLSGKDVLALGVELFVNNRKRLSSLPQGKEGQPLIAAGGSYDLIQSIAKGARPTLIGYEPDTPPNQQVVIATAVFRDGSYEGNARTAATFRAFLLGRKLAAEKLLGVIRKLSSSPETTTSAAASSLKTQVSAMLSDSDIALVDVVLRDMPAITVNEKLELKGAVDIASNGMKTDFLKELQSFIDEPSGPAAFREWLKRKSEGYRKWLSMDQ